MIQLFIMEPTARAITWEAPEHHYSEKGGDWFFAFTIIVIAAVLSALLLGNALFALLLGVAGLTLAVAVSKKPSIIPFGVSVRGILVGDELHPYSTLKSYYLDEEDERGPQLLVLSSRRFLPLLVLPVPVEYIDDIEAILAERLTEEHLEEPFMLKILEMFGF